MNPPEKRRNLPLSIAKLLFQLRDVLSAASPVAALVVSDPLERVQPRGSLAQRLGPGFGRSLRIRVHGGQV